MTAVGLGCLLVLIGMLYCLTGKTDFENTSTFHYRHPGKNVFWQYANFTAHTTGHNNTCYACALIPHAAADPFVFELNPDSYEIVKTAWLNQTQEELPRGLLGSPDIDTQFRINIDRVFPMCFRRFHGSGDGNEDSESNIDSETHNECVEVDGGGEKCIRLTGKQISSWQRGLDQSQCNSTINLVGDIKGVRTFNRDKPFWIPDWYWYCGHRTMLYFPKLQRGRCALVRLSAHITLYSIHPKLRTPRDTSSILTVPEEYKLSTEGERLAEIIMPMYGVGVLRRDVNRVHYQLATFVNQTIKGLEGVQSELTALRLMTTQNRMALDLLLAREGGVCSMIGEHCCTYIPPNDAQEGNISMVLRQMHDVAAQLKDEERGTGSWFQGWGVILMSLRNMFFMILPSLLVVVFLLCCGPLLCNCVTETLYRRVQASYQLLQITKDPKTEECNEELGLEHLFNENDV